MSYRDQHIRLGHTTSSHLPDIFNHLQDVSKMSCQDIFRALSKSLQDILQKLLQYIFNTSSRHLQEVLQRCLQGIFITYNQVKLFLLIRRRDVFSTFLRRTEVRLCTEGFAEVKLLNICKIDKNFSNFSFSLYYTF